MNLISEWYVKPKYEVEAAKERIYLTPTEIIILTIPPIQRGMLYTLTQPSDSSTITNLLVNLKHSLSIALVHFYPLAGRFTTETFPDEHACTVFIDCNKGPGARLTHVVASDLTIVDVISPIYAPDIAKKFFDLGEEFINVECHTRPLLSIQVTELTDGIFIGFTVCHSIVDGTSFMHFVSMLSEIYCSDNTSLEISRVPIYEHDKQPIKLPYLGLEEIIIGSKTDPLIDRIFHFSSKSIAMIKARANNQENTTPQLSSFQSLVSLLWRSITKARNLSADDETTCRLVINARTRLDPPLSNNSFGNYISLCRVNSKVGELLDHDIGWTASRLNDVIKAQDTNLINSVWKIFAKLILSTEFLSFTNDNHGENGVVIGGSTRFDMYGLDFGLSKAVYIFMNSGYKKDGKLKASQGREGVGSVDIEICLKEEHMVALEADREFMSFVS